MTAYILSFLFLSLAISVAYSAMKFDTRAQILKEVLLTMAYFVAGIFGLALLVWYFSR